MKIGIAGIGGIGSNVARHLAQAKVESIKMVDFDCVEISNLNRQFYRVPQVGEKKTNSLEYNLKQINPVMTIETVDRKIRPGDVTGLFSDCSIVVEGFDDRHLKKIIFEELSGTDQTIVSASGIAGYDMDRISVKKLGNCYIVGDFISDQKNHAFFPPKVAMISAMMAAIVLRSANDKNIE